MPTKKPYTGSGKGLYKPGEAVKPRIIKVRDNYSEFTDSGKLERYKQRYPEKPIIEQKTARSGSGERAAGRTPDRTSWLKEEVRANLFVRKREIGQAKDIPKEMRAASVKKLNKQMNRISKTMSDKELLLSKAGQRNYNLGYTEKKPNLAQIVRKETMVRVAEAVSPHFREKEREAAKKSLGKYASKISKNLIGKDIFRSPISPVATAFELGMGYLQGTKSKSQKKIKQLHKTAKSI